MRAGGSAYFAGIAALDRVHRVGGALDGRLRYVGGMRIADRLVLDRAQPKTLRRVVGGLLQPAIVEDQRFGLPVFEKQFAVIGAFKAARNDLAELRPIEAGAVDERNGGIGHGTVP